jgi:hypothetical protein
MYERYYKTAGITFAVSSDLPISGETFDPKFKEFEVKAPGDDTVYLHHHFYLLDMGNSEPGKKVYEKPPWMIYEGENHFTYVWTSSSVNSEGLRRTAVFSKDHTQGVIYNDEINLKGYSIGNVGSLTLFPTDQILIARLLADRKGCVLHSAGMIMDGNGLLFAGHSDAGKSTISLMMKNRANLLCDDRNIIRKQAGRFKLYGTWSHGDVEEVSSDSAELKAIFFLMQSQENRVVRLEDKKMILKKLLACLIKPFVTAKWWNKTLDVIEEIVGQVPCYELCFDKSGKLVNLLEREIEGLRN